MLPLFEEQVTDLTKAVIGVTGVLAAVFGWIQTNSKNRIRSLEREVGAEKSRSDKFERRIAACEEDRRSLRGDIAASQTERTNLSLQLNNALTALHGARDRMETLELRLKERLS